VTKATRGEPVPSFCRVTCAARGDAKRIMCSAHGQRLIRFLPALLIQFTCALRAAHTAWGLACILRAVLGSCLLSPHPGAKQGRWQSGVGGAWHWNSSSPGASCRAVPGCVNSSLRSQLPEQWRKKRKEEEEEKGG
jgi:hypothetical protein